VKRKGDGKKEGIVGKYGFPIGKQMDGRVEMDEEKEDVYLNLYVRPRSDEARRLCDRLAERLWGITRTGKHMTGGFRHATGSVIGAFLRSAAIDPEVYLYRMMGRDSFKGERVGYHPFKSITHGMECEGLLLIERGYRAGRYKGQATRFRATPDLVSLAKRHGIALSEWSEHFCWLPRPTRVNEPLVLKASSTMVRGKRLKGVRIPVDLSKPEAARLGEQVNALNAFFAPLEIKPDGTHHAFQRVFNQGDASDFNWNKGGRLISMGHSYQQMKQVDRKAITISGEATVEIDIRASHLTILHAKLGEPFDSYGVDPYYQPGIPRDVVKRWVTMTLGFDRFQSKWSSDAVKDYREKHGRTLGKDYPIKKVRDDVLELLPLLKNWETCPIRWGDLQYIESCAIVDTVHQLAMEHEVPALPVHDSIIVPASKEKLCPSVLKVNFKKHVGVEPALTVK
jgi:hypothetical protein